MNGEIKFDSEQLRETLAQIKPAAPRTVSFERIMEVLKLAAILAAGLWTIYLYYAGEKQRNALNLEQAKLDNVRAALDNQLAARDATTTGEGLFILDGDLSLDEKNSKSAFRRVDLSYQLENNGKVDTTVGLVVIEWYTGSFPKQLHGTELLIDSEPPVGALQSPEETEAQGVQWRRVTYKACRFQELAESDLLSSLGWLDQYNFDEGGCGTETYHPGFKSNNSEEAIVVSEKISLVGASIYVLYGPSGFENYLWKSYSEYLPALFRTNRRQ